MIKKPVYYDFVELDSFCKAFKNDAEAKELFEDVLCDEDCIQDMIDKTEENLPAIEGAIKRIQMWYAEAPRNFDIIDDYYKRIVGKMVLVIMEANHYKKKKEGKISGMTFSRYFTWGMIYELDSHKNDKGTRLSA